VYYFSSKKVYASSSITIAFILSIGEPINAQIVFFIKKKESLNFVLNFLMRVSYVVNTVLRALLDLL
jgi:Na+-transporting NADH:ubiquinone oxidoreductase subunit NqrE